MGISKILMLVVFGNVIHLIQPSNRTMPFDMAVVVDAGYIQTWYGRHHLQHPGCPYSDGKCRIGQMVTQTVRRILENPKYDMRIVVITMLSMKITYERHRMVDPFDSKQLQDVKYDAFNLDQLGQHKVSDRWSHSTEAITAAWNYIKNIDGNRPMVPDMMIWFAPYSSLSPPDPHALAGHSEWS